VTIGERATEAEMSKEKVLEFWKEIEGNPELGERLQQLAEESREDPAAGFVRLAAERGVAITKEDVASILDLGSRELTDQELDAAAGGISITYLGRMRFAFTQLKGFKPPSGREF